MLRDNLQGWVAGKVQQSECLPPTNVARVQFWPGDMGVKFVVCSHLAPRVFRWVLWFSSLHKNQRLNSNLTRIEGLHENQQRLI